MKRSLSVEYNNIISVIIFHGKHATRPIYVSVNVDVVVHVYARWRWELVLVCRWRIGQWRRCWPVTDQWSDPAVDCWTSTQRPLSYVMNFHQHTQTTTHTHVVWDEVSCDETICHADDNSMVQPSNECVYLRRLRCRFGHLTKGVRLQACGLLLVFCS